MDRDKRMFKTTIIYFIGNFGSKLLSFFLLPIYTAWLDPAAFGKVDLILNIVPLIGPIFTLQTTESIFRFLFDCKNDEEIKKNITSAFVIYILGFLSFLVFFIPYCFFTKFEYAILFALYFLFLYLGIFVQQVMRGFHQNTSYAISGIISTLIQGVTNIALIQLIAENSLLIAPILSSICIFIFGFFKTKLFRYIDLNCLEINIIKKQLQYAIPLVPNQICWWFNGVVGKYIVNFFVGGNANGLLAVATRFPNLVSTIMQIYFLAWTENSIYEYDSTDRDEYFSNNLNGLISFLLFCMSGLLLVVKIYFDFTIDKAYSEALNLIPILFIAMFFNSIATFLGTIYTASKKTKDAFFTTIYAAITNLICSFIFISKVGIYGYAIANLISYIVFAIIRYKSVNRICKISIKFPSLTAILCIFISLIGFFYCNYLCNIGLIFIIGIIVLLYYKDIAKKFLGKIIKK